MTVTIDLNGGGTGNNNTTTFNDGSAPTATTLFGSATVSISGAGASMTSLALSGFNPNITLSLGGSTTFTTAGRTFTLVNNGSGNWSLNLTSGSSAGFAWQNALQDLQVNATANSVPHANETITLTPGGTNLGTVTTGTETLTVTCFFAGTRIATPKGQVAIELLKPGELVLTADGRTLPVSWLGVQTVSTVFADKMRVLPIRIKAGALADNVPARDLLVSPDHAMFVDGVLVHAGALVNGTSIVRETKVPQIFPYYHVELDEHALIVAEGAAAESFIDNTDRLGFDNWAEHDAAYPDGKAIKEMHYPRAKSHRQVPVAVRVRLADRGLRIAASEAAEVA